MEPVDLFSDVRVDIVARTVARCASFTKRLGDPRHRWRDQLRQRFGRRGVRCSRLVGAEFRPVPTQWRRRITPIQRHWFSERLRATAGSPVRRRPDEQLWLRRIRWRRRWRRWEEQDRRLSREHEPSAHRRRDWLASSVGSESRPVPIRIAILCLFHRRKQERRARAYIGCGRSRNHGFFGADRRRRVRPNASARDRWSQRAFVRRRDRICVRTSVGGV